MADKIVGLRGEFVPETGKPNAKVVAELEMMLAEARAGTLHCVSGACDTQQGVRWFLAGTGMGFDMIGGLEMAKRRIADLMVEE